jgi:hypothetical protein
MLLALDLARAFVSLLARGDSRVELAQAERWLASNLDYDPE